MPFIMLLCHRSIKRDGGSRSHTKRLFPSHFRLDLVCRLDSWKKRISEADVIGCETKRDFGDVPIVRVATITRLGNMILLHNDAHASRKAEERELVDVLDARKRQADEYLLSSMSELPYRRFNLFAPLQRRFLCAILQAAFVAGRAEADPRGLAPVYRVHLFDISEADAADGLIELFRGGVEGQAVGPKFEPDTPTRSPAWSMFSRRTLLNDERFNRVLIFLFRLFLFISSRRRNFFPFLLSLRNLRFAFSLAFSLSMDTLQLGKGREIGEEAETMIGEHERAFDQHCSYENSWYVGQLQKSNGSK